MNYRFFSLLVCVTAGLAIGSACDGGENDPWVKACGPCGDVAYGDSTISGIAQLDGIFKAVADLDASVGKINTDFDLHVREIAGAFGIEAEGKSTASLVGEIKAAFNTQVTANLNGGLAVDYRAPKCTASANLAIEAKAKCEAKAGCDVNADFQCDPGKLSFECQGKCEGKCEGTCEVPTCEVAVTGPELACEGSCQGSCAVEVSAACSGSCEGTCTVNGESTEIRGTCEGTCEGTCVVEGQASCEGECRGSCKYTGPTAEAKCTGDLRCEGTCQGSCSGGCEGEIQAPKCDGEVTATCDASVNCEASASAQASANLECTPPSLKLDYAFDASVDAEARAAIMAKLDTFRAEMIGVLQGWAELRTLIEGDASVGIDPPALRIKTELQAIGSAVAKGDIDLPAPRLLICAKNGVTDAAKVLTSIPKEFTATLKGQADLLSLIKIQ